MSWTTVKARGSGKVAFRMQVEGWPHQFVSDRRLSQTAAESSDGAEWVAGLVSDSISFSEDADIVRALIESSGMTVNIMDRELDDRVTASFAYPPDKYAYIKSDVSTVTTTISVNSTAGWVADDVMHIGTEAVKIGTVRDANTFTGCTRAMWGSTAQKHWTSDGAALSFPTAGNRPINVEGRRVSIYAVGEEDLPSTEAAIGGDSITLPTGDLIWRGVAVTDARLNSDGTIWSFTIDPITSLLKQDMGQDLDEPTIPRGAYYPGNQAYRVMLHETDPGGLDPITNTKLVTGFFETNEDLVDQLNTMTTSMFLNVSSGGSIRAVADGDSGWHWDIETGTNAPYMRSFVGMLAGEPTDQQHWLFDSSGNQVDWDDIQANTNYTIPVAHQLPRGAFGQSAGSYSVPETISTWPSNRVYIDGNVSTANLSVAVVDWGDSGDPTVHRVETSSAAQNWVQLSEVYMHRAWGFPQTDVPELSFRRQYVTGDLAEFRDVVTLSSPHLANLGFMPLLTTDDLSSWTTEVDRAHGGFPLLSKRRYEATASFSVEEMISQECRLLNLYPHMDSSQKIALSPLTVASPTDPAVKTLDGSVILVDEGGPTWEKNALGSINTVLFRTRWNTEEHVGPTFIIRDVTGISQRKASRRLSVEPIADTVASGGTGDYSDYVNIAYPKLAVFSGDYAVVTMDVNLKAFDVYVGDVVKITHPWLPNPSTGKRGIVARPAIVIGREWQPARGRGKIKALLSYEKIGGYSPAFNVSATSGTPGTDVVVTVTNSDPDDTLVTIWDDTAFDTLADAFPVGALVELVRWDMSVFTPLTGVVDSVNEAANQIDLTLDASWSGLGGNKYFIRYQSAGAIASTADPQSVYAHQSASDFDIDYSDASKPGFKFA